MATIKDGKGTVCLASFDTSAQLTKHEIGRPAAGPLDVEIKIAFCGMCHSDVSASNGDWGMSNFPIACGHEMAGLVTKVGAEVTTFKAGDRVGVGCFVDSCGSCELCLGGDENYCSGCVQAYGTTYPLGKGHDECAGTHTNGGYSSQITVKQDFVYRVPDDVLLEHAGPLLCAGITMFGPLNRHVLGRAPLPGGAKRKVGIVGFGGLGHMGIKLARAMDCEVTILSRSDAKKDAAVKLGADMLLHSNADALAAAAHSFDLIIDTVPHAHEVAPLMGTLKKKGTYCMIGGVPQPVGISPFGLLMNNWNVEGSLVGGIPETKKMLAFCAEHKIVPDIFVIHAKDASAQFKALADGTASPERAVIDMSTLSEL